jgi:hypothetical protein
LTTDLIPPGEVPCLVGEDQSDPEAAKRKPQIIELSSDERSIFVGLIPLDFNAPYNIYPQIRSYQGLVFLVALQPAVETIPSPKGHY